MADSIHLNALAGTDLGPHNMMMQCSAGVVFGDNGTDAVVALSHNVLGVARATGGGINRYQVVLRNKFDKLGTANLYYIQACIQNTDPTYLVSDNPPVHIVTTYEADDIIGVSIYDADTPTRQWLDDETTVPVQFVHLMLWGRRIVNANGPVQALGKLDDRFGIA